MSEARVKKMVLPDAPKPTRAVKYVDPREKERQQRLSEHRNIVLGVRSEIPLCFWDSARKSKLKRLWEEGWQVKYIAREVGCAESVCRDRIRYEIKCGRLDKRHKDADEETIKSIVNRFKAGESLNTISKEMKMSRYFVTKILEEKGEKQ